jgi:hypothetical protein
LRQDDCGVGQAGNRIEQKEAGVLGSAEQKGGRMHDARCSMAEGQQKGGAEGMKDET